MRLIGAASFVFITTPVVATSTSGPAATAVERPEGSVSDTGRRHRDNDRPEHRFGRKIFREDTFGDEQLWTDVLQMHNVIGTVSPVAALGLGLKVDVDALPAEIIPAYAARSATGQYRTTPLRALWQHAPYFHDGSAADLLAVVNHYNQLFDLNLSEAQKGDLVEYLKSL